MILCGKENKAQKKRGAVTTGLWIREGRSVTHLPPWGGHREKELQEQWCEAGMRLGVADRPLGHAWLEHSN